MDVWLIASEIWSHWLHQRAFIFSHKKSVCGQSMEAHSHSPYLQKPRLSLCFSGLPSNILLLFSWLRDGCCISIASSFQVGRRAKALVSCLSLLSGNYLLVRVICQKNSLWQFHCPLASMMVRIRCQSSTLLLLEDPESFPLHLPEDWVPSPAASSCCLVLNPSLM